MSGVKKRQKSLQRRPTDREAARPGRDARRPGPAGPGGPFGPANPWLRTAVLVAAGLVAFGSALGGVFVMDDQSSVLENPHILSLWPLTESLGGPPQSSLGGRPLVALSFALNYAFGGLDPWGYHAWNLAVHILAGLALAALVRLACQSPRVPEPVRRDADWLSMAVALVWLVHPVQTEVIGYVTQRTESTMGLFYFLTLYCAIRAMRETRPWRWAALSAAACALGTMSKEAMVTAPVMVLLYDVVFEGGSLPRALRARAPLYGGLALCWGLLAWLIADGPRWRSAGFSSGVSPWTYLLHQPGMILTYLRLSVWPSPLVLDYGRTTPLAIQAVWPSFAAVLILLTCSLVTLWKRPMIGFLAAWFWVTLAPSSSILPIATEVGAERRMYLPLAALVFLLLLGGRWLLGRLVSEANARRSAQVALVALVCAAFVWLSYRRGTEYGSEMGIWQTVLDRRPQPRAHYNMGLLLAEAGRTEEALAYYRAAVVSEPRSYYALAFEDEEAGRIDEAIAGYQRFLELMSTDVQAPLAHIRLGAVLLKRGRMDDAARSFATALEMRPADPHALGGYAQALVQLDRIPEAVEAFGRLVAVTPQDADAHESLGMALLAERRVAEAVVPFQRAAALAPGDPQKLAMLGSTLLSVGREAEGMAALERAFAFGHDDPELRGVYEELKRSAR